MRQASQDRAGGLSKGGSGSISSSLGGGGAGALGMSVTNLDHDSLSGNEEARMTGAWDAARKKLNKQRSAVVRKMVTDYFTSEQLQLLAQLRTQLFHRLEAKVALASSASSRGAYLAVHELLEDRLKAEDKNSGGTLSRHSLFAALASIGVARAQAFSSKAQIRMLDLLEGLGQGEIIIQDFLALVFDSL